MTNYNRNGLHTNINVKREHKQQYEHKHGTEDLCIHNKIIPKKRNKHNETIPQIGMGETNNIGLHSW
jgi:hypothetical protein